jgi:hypothetical protein
MVDLESVCSACVAELDHYMLYLQYAATQSPHDIASVRVVVTKLSSVAAGLMGGRKRFGALHKEAEVLRLRTEKEDRKLLAASPQPVWSRRLPQMQPQTHFSYTSLVPPKTGYSPSPSTVDTRAIVSLGRVKIGSNSAYRGACYACAVLDLPPDRSHAVSTCPNLAAASVVASKEST